MEQSHHNETNNTLINWLLTGLASIFACVEHASADEIYTWFFRILSSLSVLLLIIINWQKAWSIVFKKDGKGKK